MTITATDGQATVEKQFWLDIANIPPWSPPVSFLIEENSPDGTEVGTASATDPGADTITYAIVGGNESGAFRIDPATGLITVANSAALDFETTTLFSLVVRAIDDDGGFGDVPVTISLLNRPSISGEVFLDINANGLFDANDVGLNGVVIELQDLQGNVLDTSATLGGVYQFEDLIPGTWRIHEIQPTGVDDGPEVPGSGGFIVANDTMQVTPGSTHCRIPRISTFEDLF